MPATSTPLADIRKTLAKGSGWVPDGNDAFNKIAEDYAIVEHELIQMKSKLHRDGSIKIVGNLMTRMKEMWLEQMTGSTDLANIIDENPRVIINKPTDMGKPPSGCGIIMDDEGKVIAHVPSRPFVVMKVGSVRLVC